MQPVGDTGARLRDHLEAAARQSGRADKRLRAQCPLPLSHVWGLYSEEFLPRPNSGFGPQPLTHGEIAEWMRVTGDVLSAFEVKALRAVNIAHLSAVHKRSSKA